jgi:hypothetical protein
MQLAIGVCSRTGSEGGAVAGDKSTGTLIDVRQCPKAVVFQFEERTTGRGWKTGSIVLEPSRALGQTGANALSGVEQNESRLCGITSHAMMPHLISDRVKELRAEIAAINHANLLCLKGENSYTQEAERQRRAERLRDILDELTSLTDWKKL